MLYTLTRVFRVLADSVSHSAFSRKSAVPAHAFNRPPAIESLECRTLMSTYYVSPTGDDSNSGTSISSPWKSIGMVNSRSYKLGDSILFQGGQTFYGTLQFTGSSGGSTGGYVTVSSYDGRATISSGTSDGADVIDTSGFDFENLKFQGSPGGITQYGILFQTTVAGLKRSNVKVNNSEITGYNGSGIMVEGDADNAGFEYITLTNNDIHANVQTGIYTYALTNDANDYVYVGYNMVYDNYGDGTSYVTGSGIELGYVNDALVEHNQAYLNGVIGGNGGVGIWAYASNDVTFQFNESFDNHGYRGHDGDGFDFDADTSNSVMQYNYAANNDGTGYQLDQWKNDNLFTDDIVRDNVAENNGLRNNYGSIETWGRVLNSSFDNNTVYISPSSTGSPSGIHVYNTTIAGLYVSNVTYADNTIVATGGLRMVYVPSAEVQGATDLTFVGNTYDASGSSAVFSYNNVTYYSLSAWADSTGQEKQNGIVVGRQTAVAMAAPAFATTSAAIADASVMNSSLSNNSNLNAVFGTTKLKDLFDQSVTATPAE